MRYLITMQGYKMPFLTDWFDAENHFDFDFGMIVYDLCESKFTTDGRTWYEIEIDHL